MSTDAVQLIKNAQIESACNYLQFVKMSEHALTPTRESAEFAELTLRSPYHTTVPAEGKDVIPTDLQIKLPEGYYGRIVPTTDLASSPHISIGSVVVDAEFRGNLSVLLFNHSKYPYNIYRGDKIATLICDKIYYPELDLVERLDDTTWRGARGFGSTGLNILYNRFLKFYLCFLQSKRKQVSYVKI